MSFDLDSYVISQHDVDFGLQCVDCGYLFELDDVVHRRIVEMFDEPRMFNGFEVHGVIESVCLECELLEVIPP